MVTKLEKLMMNRKIEIFSKLIIVKKMNIYLAKEDIAYIHASS